MQEIDAERRLQTLRRPPYESINTLPSQAGYSESINGEVPIEGQDRARKRRRIAGEDDTERDLRLFQEDAVRGVWTKLSKRKKTSDAPLTDQSGHINLFPIDQSHVHVPKNTKVEAEAMKRKKEHEDQCIMRFSNAAGSKQAVDQKPWYSSATVNGESEEPLGKDVWGNKDPRRKTRERDRVATDDPLTMMQKGVQGLRQVEKERKVWKEERAREIKATENAERRHKSKSIHNRVEDLDTFNLDTLDVIPPKGHSYNNGEEKSYYKSCRS